MPAATHAASRSLPYSIYGPTVVMTDLVCATIALSDAGSLASATISGVSGDAPIASRTEASFSLLRPAIAHFGASFPV